MTTEVVDVGGKRRDTTASVRELYVIDTRITASLAGSLFKAVDKGTRVSVGLWLSRWPLDEVQAGHFLSKVSQRIESQVQPEVLSFGLDAARYGWVAFRPPSGRHILDGKLEQREIERRYLGCVRSVAQYHRLGVACGDICLDTFLLQSGGEPRFMGGLGALASPQELHDAVGNPDVAELATYCAPELQTCGQETMRGDVFSLAVLAYRLFLGDSITGSFPGFCWNSGVALPPIPGVPKWIHNAVLPILEGEPSSRPADADELVALMMKARQSELEESLSDEQDISGKGHTVRRSSTSVVSTRASSSSNRSITGRNRFVWPLLLALCIAAAGIVVGMKGPGSLGGGWSIFGTSSVAVQQSKLSELTLSDDPLAHEALLRMLKEAPQPETRTAIISGVIARARRLGLLRTSDLVREWYGVGEPKRMLTGDHPVALTVINPFLSDAAREGILLQAYPSDRAEIAQIASAIALDRAAADAYREVFVKASRDLARVEDANGHSTKALMLSLPMVRALFFGDLMDSPPELTTGDTAWLLNLLGSQGDPQVRKIAALGIGNGTYVGAAMIFADALRSGVSLPLRERTTLIACLGGKMSTDSVSVLVASYFPEASQVLFAIAYLSSDEAVRRAAFDGVATKPIADPFVRKLSDFVRNKRAQQRDAYVRALATMAISANLNQAEFNQGFTIPETFSTVALRDKEFVTILLRSAPPRVVSAVLQLVGGQLDVGDYLELLSNPHKEVRLEGLQRLDGTNDATAITFIRQSYEREQDPDVRGEYRSRFFSDEVR